MRLALAAALALTATAALAQQSSAPPTKPGSKSTAAITGGTYQADPNHTLVIWTLDHLGISPLSGSVGEIEGTLQLDPKNPNAAKVDITIPTAKLTAVSEGLTAHLHRAGKDGGKPDFFGPAPAPARFVSTKVTAHGQTATITGNLTLNGATRPVTLQASFYGAGKAPPAMGGKENVGFHATATIQRSQFGLGLGVPIVGDEVKLDIAAAFQK